MFLSSTAWLVSVLLAQSAPATPDVSGTATGAEFDGDRQKVVVVGTRRRGAVVRAQSRVERTELDERLPRSAPDALRYEPGVYVQQSAHGQGSPYIRGRTGQQTVVLFDGVRLNTSTWRQGPNQYFFTVDSAAIESIEVTRGGASTLFGSDAIAGVIEAHPAEPHASAGRPAPETRLRGSLRAASADGETGARIQMDARLLPSLSLLAGVGARRVGALRSGGPLESPATGTPPMVPVFAEDGVTQLGTGFRELTGDVRVRQRLPRAGSLVAAAYVYRQYDSPRTDQCPAPFAPRDECLDYDQQFRTLAYLAHEASFGAWAERWRLTLSYQRQHERRSLRRPGSFVENGGRDDVDTLGMGLKADSALAAAGPVLVGIRWGGDLYLDRVTSAAWSTFTDVATIIPLSRGLYLDGSSYLQGGVFGHAEARIEAYTARGGLRLSGAMARADAEPTSGTAAVRQQWPALVGNLGLERRFDFAAGTSALFASYDRSFRAPNLDDLTSRQQTGPGFQFENPDLGPETADTFEIGARLEASGAKVDLWLFRSILKNGIARSHRAIADCPPATPACNASWSRFQLVNAPGLSIIDGLELSGRWVPTGRWTLRGSVAYARGEGPNPQARPVDPDLPYVERVPLSRVPPLNGSFELRWAHAAMIADPKPLWARLRPYLGAGLRWALLQDRLAPTDLGDARIPPGGTPGFVVFDLRAGFRLGQKLLVAAVLENLGDAAYRYHGSSVNGPGRGLIVNLEGSL